MAAVSTPRSRSQSRTTSRAVSGRDLSQGLQVPPLFCPTTAVDPFDTVTWTKRSAQIKDESGKLMFEQKDVEIPENWTQLATNVIVSKYFYGENGTPERERSVKQLIHRVTRTIADWGIADGYFASAEDGENFYRDLTWLCLHQHGAFNSPVWFNVGLHHLYGVSGARCNWRWNPETLDVEQPENPYEYPQGSACFIQSVDDNMEAIMRLATSEAMLFKFGSGTGTDLSTLRSHREKLSGGGKPSGPLSFMRVYDQIAAVVKSGGKTRRAAKMQSLKVWHPDILEFIECKWKEEKKAHCLIEKGGYEANFNGEAYSSILFQNANLSVRLTDEFMQAVEQGQNWQTHWVTDQKTEGPAWDAKWLLTRMAECAWQCGDPGVQYDTTINRWHTCPNSGRINASNPCVTGDTLVMTSAGMKRIDRLLEDGFEVMGSDGAFHPVGPAFQTGVKPVYRLRTRSGYEVKLTADHRVLTSNRGDVAAGDLTRDDVVVLGRGAFESGHPDTDLFGSFKLDERLSEILGLAVGDGCLMGEQETLMLTLGPDEGAVAARVEENLQSYKAEMATDGRQARECRVHTPQVAVRIGTSSRCVVDQMKRFAILNEGSQEKAFTEAVFELDRQALAGVLRGLFTADGTVANYGSKSQYVSLDSTSLKLLQQTQLLLLSFGIKSKLYCNRRLLSQTVAVMPDGKGGVREYPVAQLHSLRISRSSRYVFEQEIGFINGSPKCEKLRRLNREVTTYADRLEDRVESLEFVDIQPVYDLTEPVTSHFVANGIVVHNCSEYMFLDDTACNLASINLMKFRLPDGTFDVERFQSACRLYFIAQEILVDHASYPTADIARNSHMFRPLGLGYSNLGSLIMSDGLAYDSEGAYGLCGSVTALLHGAANLTSAEMAGVMGPFDGYAANREPMLRVMQMHRDAVEKINDAGPQNLKEAARQVWDEVLSLGRKVGYRNAQATVLAPTGTISFMMDCDTTGIEPDIALVKYKQLAGGGMLKILNNTVPLALNKLGYDDPQIKAICEYIDKNDTIEGAPQLADEHLSVFDCAFKPASGVRSINWKAHVRMMAAAQPFLSGAISKTVNMPHDVTPQDIADCYFWGWQLDLKALAIYRDGSKQSQPLNTSNDKKDVVEKIIYQPRRDRLPDTRQSITHKFNVGGHEGYINVGMFPDGRPGELFITMAKEGSTVGGMMDAFGTSISIALQYGVPLEALVNKFSHMRFEPMGHTTNPDIRIAKSVVDYIFRWMGMQFLAGFREASRGELPSQNETEEIKPITGPTPVTSAAIATPVTKSAAPPAPIAKTAEKSTTNGQHPPTKPAAKPAIDLELLERAGLSMKVDGNGANVRNEQFARFQLDAPSCENCGSITVRNGNCYLCHNCGNSMGCS